jgi:hypothetical protein
MSQTEDAGARETIQVIDDAAPETGNPAVAVDDLRVGDQRRLIIPRHRPRR